MKAAMLIGRGQIIHNTEQAPESRGKLQGPQLLPSLSTGSASGSHYTTPALRKSNRPGSQSPHPGQSRPKFSRKAQRPTAQTLCLEPLPAPRPKRPNGCCSLAGPAFEPPWATFTHCPAFYPIEPTVEQAAGLAVRAVTAAEPHNPERYGGSHAIRRQDWRRGTQDCVLHLKAWHARLRAPLEGAARSGACRQACRAGGRAGRATQPERHGGSHAIRRQDWRRGTQDRALHLKGPPAVEHAATLAMRAVVPAEQHAPGLSGSSERQPPPGLAAWHARLRAPLQGVARKTARST